MTTTTNRPTSWLDSEAVDPAWAYQVQLEKSPLTPILTGPCGTPMDSTVVNGCLLRYRCRCPVGHQVGMDDAHNAAWWLLCQQRGLSPLFGCANQAARHRLLTQHIAAARLPASCRADQIILTLYPLPPY